MKSTKEGIEFSLDDTAFHMDDLNDNSQYDRSIYDNTFILEYKEKLFKMRRENSRLRKALSVVNFMLQNN